MDSPIESFTLARKQPGTWRAPILFVGGTVALYALYFASPWSSSVMEGWETDFQAAVDEAAASKRPILVAFSMRGCPPCQAMARNVLSTPEVRGALKSFVLVDVDVDRQRELANRYEVFGTPTYAVLSAKGDVLAHCTGYQPEDAFLKFLRNATARGYGAALSTRD